MGHLKPVAVATSIFVVVITVLVASVGHVYGFIEEGGGEALRETVNVAMFTVPGVLIGGQIGPRVGRIFDFEVRVALGDADPEPNEREERVWKPVHPTDVANSFAGREQQVHPDIQELVRTQAGKKVHFEPVGPEEFPSYVEVALERHDVPSDGAFRQRRS